MKKLTSLILTLALALFVGACATKKSPQKAPRKIAVQMWTTHDYTLEESIIGLAKIGIDTIETTPIQKISKKFGKALFNHYATQEQRDYVKNLLKQYNMKICTIYCRPPADEADLQKLMEFGKFFGVNMYVSESRENMLPLWEKYCEKYNAKMAIHCHQRGSNTPYWDPKVVRKIVDQYKHIGFCAETGAWSRSGVDPVYALKVAEGKIFALHLKDQKTFNDIKSAGVNYGTGVLDMKAILAELDRQGFDHYYVIEQGDDQKNAFEIARINKEYLQKN
jgi:sugar phosphate isomerase/epimerase